MPRRHSRKRTTPMACNSERTSSLLPSLIYFILASNGIGTTVRAYAGGHYSMVAFIISIYLGFLLMECCLSAYRRLPPHQKSRKKFFLKFAIWFLFSAIMLGFAHQFAPFFCLAAALSLYAVAAAGSALLLYVYFIDDDTKGCADCCREEKTKRSRRACPVEEASDPKIQEYDSILEKV